MIDTVARFPSDESSVDDKPSGDFEAASNSGMSAILFHAFDTVNRHKLPIIGAGVAGILLGVIIALMTPPQYRATTRVEINTDPTEVLPNEIPRTGGSSIIYDRTALGLLEARSLADRVARDLNLASDPAVVDQTLPRDTRQQIAAGVVQQGTSIELIQMSRLVDIGFSFGEPGLAARIANGIAENFIQASLDRHGEQAQFQRKFLEGQLATVRDKLEQSERDILSFERAEDIVAINGRTENGEPTSESISNLQLETMAGAYANAQKDRISAEQAYRKAAQTPVDATEVSGALDQIAQLRAKEAELSKTFLPDYPKLVALRANIDVLERGIVRIESDASSRQSQKLRAKYQIALAEEQQFEKALQKVKSAILVERGDNTRYTILARDVDTNRKLYNALLEQYKIVSAVGGVGENEVAIVDRAEPPAAPFWPNIPLNVVIGLVFGGFLGFLGAFVYDLLHEKIIRPADVEQRLKVKSLGSIPEIGEAESVAELLEDPKSPVTEAYLSVANLLRLATQHGVPRTLLVTSTIPEEGKSSSSYGLAKSFLKTGKRVLLVDADLRRPTFRVGNNPNDRGLSNLLAGEISLDEAIIVADDGLSYILTGGTPPNPSELFSNESIGNLIAELRSRFEVVIFDAPPILSLVDAPALASRCDATLLIIQSDRLRVSHAQQSVSALRNAGAYIVGALITKYDADRDSYSYNYGYGSGYGYSYGSDTEEGVSTSNSRRMIVGKEATANKSL